MLSKLTIFPYLFKYFFKVAYTNFTFVKLSIRLNGIKAKR